MRRRNVLVAQSGGPTAVINASLLGVIKGCSQTNLFGDILAAKHGIEGLLREELLDLTSEDPAEIDLLKMTPAAGAIGTCRYKVKPDQKEDLQRILGVLEAHQVGTFIYIGGNDSMETAHRVDVLAKDEGLELCCLGIPKTIDNDLGDQVREIIDHTPGYGSVARYWAHLVLCANEENRGSRPADPVLVLQAMGRRIGFIPAAARLADPERRLPLQIYLPESKLSLENLIQNVHTALRQHGRAIVVVSEGFDVGSLGERKDAFGHVAYGSNAQSVAQVVVNALNAESLPVPGSARGQIPGTDQRHAIHLASPIDLAEALEVGRHAARLAAGRHSGLMVTIRREADDPYTVTYGSAPLADMANSERTFPQEWICDGGIDVSDEFLDYARPLIGDRSVVVPTVGGLPRFARLSDSLVKKRCSDYVPEIHRKETE
jgi:ATP-dependent phosphofructokinase / diphosphate-dependent phosphofructokinase